MVLDRRWRVVIEFAAFFVGGVLGAFPFWGQLQQGQWQQATAYSLTFAILGFLMSRTLLEIPAWHQKTETEFGNLKRDIATSLNAFEKLLESDLERLGDMALPSAASFSPPSRNFHSAISRVVDSRGSVRWLLAKFIARKLGFDFRSFNKQQLSYYEEEEESGMSNLLGRLIPECEREIVFTFPYTPEGWVRAVYKKEYVQHKSLCSYEKCSIVGGILNGRVLLPDHLAQVGRSKAKTRTRLVTKEWPNEDSCYLRILALCSLMSTVETQFVGKGFYDSKHPTDENLLDDVLVSYRINEKTCILQLDPSDARQRIQAMRKQIVTPPNIWKEAENWAHTVWSQKLQEQGAPVVH